MRTTRVLSLSLPPELLAAAEQLAREEGRTRSELFREALRHCIREQKWRQLREYGAWRARELELRESDVERAIQAYRKPKRAP